MMSSRRLFGPPCMSSAVTIHPQSIYSNLIRHKTWFCQPNVHALICVTTILWCLWFLHTHEPTCDEGDGSFRSTLIDIMPLALVHPVPLRMKSESGKSFQTRFLFDAGACPLSRSQNLTRVYILNLVIVEDLTQRWRSTLHAQVKRWRFLHTV